MVSWTMCLWIWWKAKEQCARKHVSVSFVLSMEPGVRITLALLVFAVWRWEASVESVPLLRCGCLNSKILAGIQKGSGETRRDQVGTFARAHDLRLKSLRFTGSQKDHFMVAEHVVKGDPEQLRHRTNEEQEAAFLFWCRVRERLRKFWWKHRELWQAFRVSRFKYAAKKKGVAGIQKGSGMGILQCTSTLDHKKSEWSAPPLTVKRSVEGGAREWSAPPLTVCRRRSSRISAQSTFGKNPEGATKNIWAIGGGTRSKKATVGSSIRPPDANQQSASERPATTTPVGHDSARHNRRPQECSCDEFQSQPRTVVDIKASENQLRLKEMKGNFARLQTNCQDSWMQCGLGQLTSWKLNDDEDRVVSACERAQRTAACSPRRAGRRWRLR